ncbi:hypothetical protein O1611_g1380 [Lasiodiplodia mahajangana]|uniref:Uncharacterized protein n=1 Tax=Lasiodiplodia mahajangana TaxID=1108764 RepID=A0ACC2JXW5_9PEZI|nr:hypothetical protein O1611_g1380 [Lasiodiplodia mahajangana]
MSNTPGIGSTAGGYLPTLAFLTLLALADGVLSNVLPIVLGPESPQVPGFWNLTTMALIISTISDLIGQLVSIPLIYHYGSRYAMNVNSLSVLVATTYSLISLVWRSDGRAWAVAIAPVLKIIGGGSHATIFIIITVIQKNTSGNLRAALIYTTGAVVVACQSIATEVTSVLARKSLTLPYIFSITCCILASVITIVYNTPHSPASDHKYANDPSTQPLLHVTAGRDVYSVAPLLEECAQRWHNIQPGTRKILTSLGFIFLVAAIAKATRPLFLNYIQHHVGVTPETASAIWFMSIPPGTVALYTAKSSIILLAIGALLIGMARSEAVLVSGLVINTLGIATDLALIVFAADAVTEEFASCLFMTIASLESAGTIIGIGLLYPLYQLCLNDSTLFGGMPYYICAGLFTAAGDMKRSKPVVSKLALMGSPMLSAELSEAINSMYRWYENATLCYVHLADVDGVEHDGMESFRRSQYWTRGWTLQELIAPHILIFFSSDWARIGTRLDVREVVAEATNIPKAVLRFRNMRDYSVSQKMSWASRRQTTRLEDEAYCLLGLFGVTMPLLYGEGRRAFRRLQEEIIKELDDESIFAWQGGTDHGLLASCPAQFAFSHSIQRSNERPISDSAGDLPFAITNRGIRISLPVLGNCHTVPLFSLTRVSSEQYLVPNPRHLQGGIQERVLAVLNCQQATDTKSRVAIVLNYDDSRGRYTRDVNIGLVKISIDDIAKQATLKQLLVAAGGKSPWDDTVMDDDPGRLVVIQGLTGMVAHYKFERAILLSGRELDCDVQENGTISVRFFKQRRIAVIYRDNGSSKHPYLVIYLRPSEINPRIDATITPYGQDVSKETILDRIARDSQSYLSNRHTKEIVHGIPRGTYDLSLRIREAEHASVVEVAVEPQEYPGTSQSLVC